MSTKRDASGSSKTEPTEEQIELLEKQNQILEGIEVLNSRNSYQTLKPFYNKRGTLVKGVPKFWNTVLSNNMVLGALAAAPDDAKALSFLTEIRAVRDDKEHRAFSFEFEFATNPFFEDKVLKKEWKYIAPKDPQAFKADENGITPALLEFDLERDTEVIGTKIKWKDDQHNLTKLGPVQKDPEDDEVIEDLGSFFNIFEVSEPKVAVFEYDNEVLEVFEDAINYFFGRGEHSASMMMGDTDDEIDEEDDDDEGSIDLEAPEAKKPKKA